MASVDFPHFEQLLRHAGLRLSMLCCLGLLVTTGCFQQRYEPANWESASRPAAKKRPAPPAAVQAGTSLPGKPLAATTLPGRNQSAGNSTLPGRNQPQRSEKSQRTEKSQRSEKQVQPGNNRGNTTMPARPRRGNTTLPERPGRDSNTTLPSREPRRAPESGRNSGTTLPGRR